MGHRIGEDHEEFRKVVSGRVREELKKFIRSGKIFRRRGKNGKIGITIPRIDLPHIVFGKPQEGVGRGPGKDGDVIGKDPGKGKSTGSDGDHAEGIEVQVELEYILKLLKDELELPELLPKQSQTFEDEKTVYNGIAKVGPNALLHKRRTLKETMKRMAAMGTLENKTWVPGFNEPVSLLLPNNDDRRYRQYNIIKRPTSNAVIFYMRDGSGSMDSFKCEIVSDICWWLDLWIRTFYKKTESVYLWHDTEAKEVSQEVFYNLRMGGGTRCSSALRLMKKLIAPKGKFDPFKWNIYAFYFGDGENEHNDNAHFLKLLKNDLGPNVVNLFGLGQVLAHGYDNTLKGYIDKKLEQGELYSDHCRTTSVERPEGAGWDFFQEPANRDEAVKKALKDLLGKNTRGRRSNVRIEEIGASI
jgi:uncharacterized protein